MLVCTEYSAPASICGYVAAAVAKHLATKYTSAVMTKQQVLDMVADVSSVDALLPLIRDEMRRLHDERSAYVAAHPDEFASEGTAFCVVSCHHTVVVGDVLLCPQLRRSSTCETGSPTTS